MGLSVSESKPFVTTIPQDTHSGTCVGIFDLGTVHNTNYGKDEQRIMILWEFADLTNSEGLPETIHKEYSASLSEKANLRQMLTNWRGKPFTPAELQSFHVKAVLGQPCQILIIHGTSKTKPGNLYANIHNVMGWPKGATPPKRKSPLMCFEFGVDTEVPAGTPTWIASKIEAAPEWLVREDLVRGLADAAAPDFGPPPPSGVNPDRQVVVAPSFDAGPGVSAAAVAAATSAQSAEELQGDDDAPPF